MISGLKHKFLGCITVLTALAFSGCVDKSVISFEESMNEDVEGFALQFRVSANPVAVSENGYCDGESDYWEGYECYIDPAKLRVLIFDEEDKFLFEVNTKHIYRDDSDSRNYFVRMSGTDLNNYLSEVYDENEPKAILDTKFKVAVLANWPNNVEGRRVTEDSGTDYTGGDPLVESVMVPYNRELTIGDPIFKLSHLAYDNVYGVSQRDDDNNLTGMMASPAFSHLVDVQTDNQGDYADQRGKMGVYSIWAHNYHQSDVYALNFIRNAPNGDGVTWHYKDWSTDDASHFGYHRVARMGSYTTEYDIRDVWHDWNFTNGEYVRYHTENSEVEGFWKKQNERLLNSKIESGKAFTDLDGLSFVGTGLTKDASGVLKVTSSVPSSDYGTNYFSLRAKGEGMVRLVCRLEDESKYPQIITTTPGNGKRTVVDYTSRDLDLSDMVQNGNDANGIVEYSFKVDPQTSEYIDVRIYGNGSEMEVFEICYIHAMEVYMTDRIGQVPNPDYLIPMYGVQEFNPIRAFIEPNTLFSLSDGNQNICEKKNEYDYKSIFLLRSVAKIEVYVNKNYITAKPSHIAMRSMNRSARCEPMDVWTPTELIWNGTEDGKYVGIDQEIQNIKSHGYFYDKDSKDDGTASAYKQKQGWFNKVWADEQDWDWNSETFTITDDRESPRIMNSRIDRCDYTHFNYAGEINGYYKYILYMPEKNIDDPDDKGELSVTPKVAHIEFRFEDASDNVSLGSHGAYRIYFANYNEGDPFSALSDRTQYDTYIKANPSTTLGKLYPVIRNHVYQFYVDGLNSQSIDFMICTPAPRKANDITFN